MRTAPLLLVVLCLAGGVTEGAIRVVAYNTLDNPTNSFDDGNLRTIFDAIATKSVNGIAQRPDIIAVQEQTSSGGTQTADRIADELNDLFGVTSYTAQLNGAGNDRVGVVYDTASVSLISSVNVFTSGPRTTYRGQFRPVGYTDPAADLYVYSAHFKAGSSGSDVNTRANEGTFLRINADALGPDANVVFAGDFNFGSSSEQGYLNLQSGNGNTDAADPLALSSWPNSAVSEHLTQSTRTSGGDGAGGGVDDRFDLQIVSDDLLDGEGLSYIGPTSTGLGALDHSYQAFGNDGVSYNQAINNIIVGRSQPEAVLDALHDFSDHLPVVADYQVPAWMDVVVSAVPTEIELGESFDLDVMIENIADVVGVNGADELDYTLSVTGALTGSASGSLPALSGPQLEQVSLVTDTIGMQSGVINVTSNSQGVEGGSFSFPVTFEVVDPSDSADFDGDGDVDTDDLAFWEFGVLFGIGPQGFGDSDNDGDADAADLLIWQQQYTGPLPSSVAVPEPAGTVVALLGAVLLASRRKQV